MTCTVQEICAFMEDWAPPSLAYDWDKIGLQTGEPRQQVHSLMICLTITPEALKAARRIKADMIIAHHPLIWSPLKNLRRDDPQANLCLELCANNIACFIAHTNLDLARGGVNDVLAECLELRECKPLFQENHINNLKLVTFVPSDHADAVRNALAAAGAGIIGNYACCSFQAEGIGTFVPNDIAHPFSGAKGILNREKELRLEMILDNTRLKNVLDALYAAHPYEEPAYDIVPLLNKNSSTGLGRVGLLRPSPTLAAFAENTRGVLGLPCVQVYGNTTKRVNRVALLGGSGGKQIADLPRGIDVYVTGDITYHDAQTALAREISCIDAGHAGTELPVLRAIKERIKGAFKGLGVRIYREPSLGAMVFRPK